LIDFEATKLEIEQFNNVKANGILMRARANWAELGERNTKFFLNMEKRNYKKKCITKLIDENNETIEDNDKILEYEATFYKNLYSEPMKTKGIEDTERDNFFLDGTTPKLKENEINLCEKNIVLEEIGQALKE
jgi:hypothetical protein